LPQGAAFKTISNHGQRRIDNGWCVTQLLALAVLIAPTQNRISQ
jgi:hypothetical protein